MSLYKKALALHLRTMEKLAGEKITYRRLSQSVLMTGTLGGKRPDTNDDANKSVTITARMVDWLIQPYAFAENGLNEPIAGDVIESLGRTFEVRATGQGEPCWAWSDPRHTFIRIHCIEQKV